MNKNFFGILMFLMLTGGMIVNAQGVYIETRNGDEISQQMENITKGTFDGINLVFNMENKTTKTYNLLEVQKMYFYDNTVINDELQDASTLLVYPNPTNGQFQVVTNDSETIVSVWSLQGTLVLQKTISEGNNTLDLSGNSAGVYIVKTNNSLQKLILQ